MKRENSFLNISIEKDETGNKATINIDGMIGEDPFSPDEEQNTTSNMREKLKEIAQLEVEEIQVNINSLGGSVDDGLAIHDLLKENPAKVKTKISGMSASSATIIFQAGDEREISTNALMLIHRAWTMGLGNANDFEALAKDLDKTDGVISNIYAKRGNKDQDFYLELMNENGGDGRWLDADEAVEFGLVDNAVEPQFKKVAMEKSAFENLGLPVPQNMVEEEEQEEPKEFAGQLTYQVGIELDDDTLDKLNALKELSELNELKEINEENEDVDPQKEATNNNNNRVASTSSRERTLTLTKLKTKQ